MKREKTPNRSFFSPVDDEEEEEILTSMTQVIEEGKFDLLYLELYFFYFKDTYLISEKDSTSKEDQGEMNDGKLKKSFFT